MLQATPRIDVTATRVLRLDAPEAVVAIAELYDGLERQARVELARLNNNAEDPRWSRYAPDALFRPGF